MSHEDFDLLFRGLTALGALIAAGAAVFGAYQSWRNRGKLTQLQIDINGRLKALLEVTAAASHAEGVIAGTQTEQARSAVVTPVKVIQAPDDPPVRVVRE